VIPLTLEYLNDMTVGNILRTLQFVGEVADWIEGWR
jgi:hypothetical protein